MKILKIAGVIITWIIAIFICLLGLGSFLVSPITGVLVTISGLLLIPSVWKMLSNRLPFAVPGYARVIVCVILFIAGFIFAPKTTQVAQQPVAESTSTEVSPSPTTQPSEEPSPIASPKPSETPKSSPIPTSSPEQIPEKKDDEFNQSLGNTREASNFATTVILTLESTVPDSVKSIYVNEMSASLLMDITLDSEIWSNSTDDQKKDLVSIFVVSAHNAFPDKVPHVTVKTQYRTVAKGDWSIWSGEAKVELK